MKKKSNPFPILLFTLALFKASFAFSQVTLAPLNEQEIRTNLLGSVFKGEYPDGTSWAERFNPDNTSDYTENGVLQKGIMSITGSIICFSYPEIKQQQGGCFEVWKRGPNCFDFYAANSTASLDQRRFGRAWQARAWNENQPSTCLSEEIS